MIAIPPTQYVLASIPAEHILLVTINLAHQMNALPVAASWEMDMLWRWFDDEPELWVGIVTGSGTKAFCTGMDIKERAKLIANHTPAEIARIAVYPTNEYAGMTSRNGKKPIISAVNGHAHGGGFEVALNSDLILASPNATFRLPDVARGTAAMLGAHPRLCQAFGLQRAMLMTLTAYTLGAEEAREWGLVCKVVSAEKLVEEAVEMAKVISGMSPDSIVVSRAGVRQALETASVERATQITVDAYGKKLMEGENVREGLQAFLEKRTPRWVPSKL